jgi:hypothetical protein
LLHERAIPLLTTITPNPIAASTIKSHGSETRTAPGHNPVEGQAQSTIANTATGVGLDAGMILANVNAEAATAGNRTVLQTLALAVALQLNIARRQDETLDAFFLRIADALDNLPPDQRAALEQRAGLRILKVQIPELSAALRQPDSTLAARLSAAAEAPLATPQKTAAAAATTTYLQEGAGVTQAAETLAMGTQAKSNAEGITLFSSTHENPVHENQPADAKMLQSQLKSLFEPGVAETRIEIASKVEEQYVLILGDTGDLTEPTLPDETNVSATASDGLAEAAIALEGETGEPVTRLETAQSPETSTSSERASSAEQPDLPELLQTPGEQLQPSDEDLQLAMPDEGRPEAAAPKSDNRAQSLPTPQNNNIPNAATRLRAIARDIVQEKIQNEARLVTRQEDGHPVQTLLALKGLAEVVTGAAARAMDYFGTSPEAAELKQRLPGAPQAKHAGEGQSSTKAFVAEPDQTAVVRDHARDHQSGLSSVRNSDELEDAGKAAKSAEPNETASTAAAAEQNRNAIGKPVTADGVPFGFTTVQPARDEFEADTVEEDGRHEDEAAGGEDGEEEDAEARRERLARKATDDLLRPESEAEPEVRISRDSTEADRAYALYQRMGGF